MKKITILYILTLFACSPDTQQKELTQNELQDSVQLYLDRYNVRYQQLITASNEALWNASVRVGEEDSLKRYLVNTSAGQLAAFTGSQENIRTAVHFLKVKDQLTDLQYRQLKLILYIAANNPQTQKELTEKKIKLETAQNQNYFDFNFQLNGHAVTEDQIDSILASENDLLKRQKAWESSKEVGIRLKQGLADLRDLRNATVQSLGYKNFFDYQVADYNMSSSEMMTLLNKINLQLRPLYKELHTYMRYELAKKYHAPVPDLIPAHWLSNRWGQDWGSIVDVKGVNLDSALKLKTPDWILRQSQAFYMSLGFPELPSGFLEKSDLYPVPAQSPYKKNINTSAWHMNLDQDVRLMTNIEANTKWYEIVNHELIHLYNFMYYSPSAMPAILRTGTNRSYYEAFGQLTEMVTEQRAFLENAMLCEKTNQPDDINKLLKEALNYVVFIPFSTGTMSMFEYNLYTKQLPEKEFNTCWWDLAMHYQGIAPPGIRDEKYCDGATKMHIHGSPAQYYDYALSSLLVFQLHDYIATHFLHQDPRNTNYFGNKEAGNFLMDLMKVGGSRDWKDVLKEKTGSGLSAQAMLDYFSPLMSYLKKENQGRTCTLPELTDETIYTPNL